MTNKQQSFEKIPFYKERPLGDKLNATFGFIRQNWRILFRYLCYYVLPMSALSGTAISFITRSIMQMAINHDTTETTGLIGGYFGFVFFMALAGLLESAVVYSLMQLYNDRPEGLTNITTTDMRPLLRHNLWRFCKLGLGAFAVYTLASISFTAFASFGYFLFLVGFIGYILFMLAFALVPPTYIFEPVNLWQAISSGIRLGWKTLGGVFMVLLVTSLISYTLTIVTSLPFTIAFIAKALLSSGDAGMPPMPDFMNSIPYQLLEFVLSTITFFAICLLWILPMVGIAYQYSHAAEKVRALSVEEGIQHFEEMAENNQDDPDIVSDTDILGQQTNEINRFDQL